MNEQPPSISIAMATYNGAKYIREQLDDLAAQSRPPAELVICDDQSSDDTLEILEDFAASAPFPVHVHRNPKRLGYRANFIKCAGRCSSDLIAFCDQDDRWSPLKLELLAAAFKNKEVLLSYHNARPVTVDGRSLPLLDRGRSRKSLVPLSVDPWFNPLGFTQMFRRSLLGFEDLLPLTSDQNQEGEQLAHDQWYFLLASALGSIEYLPDVLADYRQHGANVYGVSWYRIIVPQLTELWHATHKRKHRLAAAEERATIFRRICGRLGDPWQQRAEEAAEWYDRFSAILRTRAELYDGQTWGERRSALAQLVRAGGLSRLSLAMDSTVGIAGLFPIIERVTRLATGR